VLHYFIFSFTRSKNPIIFNYKLNNTKLVRVTEIKDLGIYFESDFSFKFHHKNILNKSYRMLGFINRNTQHFKQPSSLKTLYCSLVRSSLEFGSIIWSQNLSTYLNDLEAVQYKFLKRIAYVSNMPISSNLFKPVQHSIGLDSIDLRRQLSDLLFIYDLLNGFIDCPHLLALLGIKVPTFFSRTNDSFVIPYYRKSYGANSFFPRALSLANKIYPSIDFFDSCRNKFKFNVLLILRCINDV